MSVRQGRRRRSGAQPIKHAEQEGLRYAPNVYTTLEEIDMFSEVKEAIARNGLPS